MATGQTAKTKTLISIDPALKEKVAAKYAAKGLSFSQGISSMLESSLEKEAVSLDKSALDAAKPVLEDMGLDASTDIRWWNWRASTPRLPTSPPKHKGADKRQACA